MATLHEAIQAKEEGKIVLLALTGNQLGVVSVFSPRPDGETLVSWSHPNWQGQQHDVVATDDTFIIREAFSHRSLETNYKKHER